MAALSVCVAVAMTVSNVADITHQRATVAPEYHQPLFVYGTDDLQVIAESQGRTVGERFVFYLDLREVAEGARLVTFPRDGLFQELLMGLARTAEVTVGDHDPDLTDGEEDRLREEARREGRLRLSDGEVVTYVVVAEPADDELVVLRGSERSVFVAGRDLFDEIRTSGGDDE